MPLVAWHGQEIIYHVAFHAIGGQLGLVGDFGIIGVKVFGEFHHRLLDELEVAHTADNHTKGYRLVGFHLFLVELGTDVKLAHTA